MNSVPLRDIEFPYTFELLLAVTDNAALLMIQFEALPGEIA